MKLFNIQKTWGSLLRLILFLEVFFAYSSIFAQTPEFTWVTPAGGGGTDVGLAIATDGSGNSFITGYFNSVAMFGPYELISYGGTEIYVAKFDDSGNILWAKQADCAGWEDMGRGVATDLNDNVIAAGYFRESILFENTTLTSAGNRDVFVTKYNPSGKVLWAKRAGGTSFDYGLAIAADLFGNTFITGYYGGAAIFDTISITPVRYADVFIAKYNPDGDILWAKSLGGSGWEEGHGIATDSDGNCIITGYFNETAYFGPFALSSFGGNDIDDIFIAKINGAGNVLWVKQAGGVKYDEGNGITTDQDNNIIVTGEFEDEASFDHITLTSFGHMDIFIAKYDQAGNLLWAHNAGGPGWGDEATSITSDSYGNIVIAGRYEKDAHFGSIVLPGTAQFAAKYDPSGDLIWAKKIAGTIDLKGVALDNIGNAMLTGSFRSTTNFDNISLTSSGLDDIFVAQLSEAPTSITVLSPNGGEKWGAGETYNILWTADMMSGYVIIALSKDSGSTWLDLPDGLGTPTPNDGQYNFTPTIQDISDQCLIKITSVDNPQVEGQSNHIFSILNELPSKEYLAHKIPDNYPAPTIDGNLDDPIWGWLSPDSLLYGGIVEAWNSDWTDWNNNMVTWKAAWSAVTNRLYVAVKVKDDVRGNFDNNDPLAAHYYPWEDESLEFFTDGDHSGGDYNGRYDIAQQWRISGENKKNLSNDPGSGHTGINTGSDFITAVTTGAIGNWTCEAVFTIYNELPGIPKTLTEGDTIGWNVWYNDSDNETYSEGYYSRDHQTGWLYTGPAWNNADYFGNIILDADLSYIIVTSPNGNDYWKVGTPHLIEWRSHNIMDEVTIEISIDAGMTWSTIVTSMPNTGSYTWTPTAAFISNQCLIKITSFYDNNVTDQSDSAFRINDKDKVDLWISTDLAGTKGDTVIIPVNSTDVTGLDIYSGALLIACDGSVLEFIDIDMTGTILAGSGWGPPTKSISPDQINLAMAGSSPLVGSGVLINILGRVVGNDGDSTVLHFSNASFNEGEPLVNTSDGLLKVKSAFVIRGQLGYYSVPTKAVSNATVQLTGTTTRNYVSDANGNYEFLSLSSGDYNVMPEKSNDDKGAITPYDASFILRYSVGLATLSPYQKIAGDVSGNGNVTSFDASWVLRYCVGLVTEFPVGADWTFMPDDFPIDHNNWSASPRYRYYLPLQSDQSGQNFMSILYGDVSGNWGSAGGAASSAVIAFNLGDFQPTQNGKWHLPLEMKFSDVAYSGSFKLLLNDRDLKFLSSSIDSSLSESVFVASKTSSGEVFFAFASAQPLNDQPVKINLLFETINPVTLSGSDFEFVDVIVDDKSTPSTKVTNQPSNQLAVDWDLGQNHPNPFNPETLIEYNIHKATRVSIKLFDLLGREIITLVDENKLPGSYTVSWNGKDRNGENLASGIYYYQIEAGDIKQTKKMALIR